MIKSILTISVTTLALSAVALAQPAGRAIVRSGEKPAERAGEKASKGTNGQKATERAEKMDAAKVEKASAILKGAKETSGDIMTAEKGQSSVVQKSTGVVEALEGAKIETATETGERAEIAKAVKYIGKILGKDAVRTLRDASGKFQNDVLLVQKALADRVARDSANAKLSGSEKLGRDEVVNLIEANNRVLKITGQPLLNSKAVVEGCLGTEAMGAKAWRNLSAIAKTNGNNRQEIVAAMEKNADVIFPGTDNMARLVALSGGKVDGEKSACQIVNGAALGLPLVVGAAAAVATGAAATN